jgi:cytochrome c oxidase assembly factor CtaG
MTMRAPAIATPGWTSWSVDPALVLGLAIVAWAYGVMYRRAARRASPARRPGPGHWLAFAVGLLTLAAALLSPIDAIGAHYLLSAHMLQHLLLADIAPALLILGLRAPIVPLGLAPGQLRFVAHTSRAGRVWGVLSSPWVALPLWAVATWLWSVPAVFDAATEHSALHALEHATLFYTGLALWWLVIAPLPTDRRAPSPVRLGYLGFTRMASAAVCIPLTWLGHTVYPYYEGAPRAYGLSALHDQQLAGAGMCFLEILVFGIAFVAVFLDLLGASDRADVLAERAADSR